MMSGIDDHATLLTEHDIPGETYVHQGRRQRFARGKGVYREHVKGLDIFPSVVSVL